MLCRETTQPMTMACKKRVALLARMGFVWQMAAWTLAECVDGINLRLPFVLTDLFDGRV